MLSINFVVVDEDGGGDDGGVWLTWEYLPNILYWPRASSGPLASGDSCHKEEREEGRLQRQALSASLRGQSEI